MEFAYMNKIKNILSATLLLALPLAFSACDDEAEYTPAVEQTNAQVFFSNSNPSKINLDATSTSFEVAIARVKTDEAITVPLTLTGGDGLYTAPSSVSFAQGEATAKIAISYDVEEIVPNVYSDITLSISDESLTTPYGMAAYTISVGIPETWTARYLGDYTYTLFFNGVDPGLTLSQSDLYADRWRISNWGGGVDFYFTWNQETNEILVDDQLIGYNHSSYGPVSVDDIVDYTDGIKYGKSYYEEGVFHFNVVYYVDAGSFGNGEELFVISGSVKN